MSIDDLNKRFAQLTDVITNAEKMIKDAEEMIKSAKQERDRLTEQRNNYNNDTDFKRVSYGSNYFVVDVGSLGVGTCKLSDIDEDIDKDYFEGNNYFKTVQRAEEVVGKINFLLRLERLHDTFCPEYVPDWNDNEHKYCVFYDNTDKRYRGNLVVATEYKTNVYFATAEIARKVCDILNKEDEGQEDN